MSVAWGCVFQPGYDKATIATTEITCGMMKDSIKSLELLQKVELQKNKDAGMMSWKRNTEELKKKSVNEDVQMWRKVDSNSFTTGFHTGLPSKQFMKTTFR